MVDARSTTLWLRWLFFISTLALTASGDFGAQTNVFWNVSRCGRQPGPPRLGARVRFVGFSSAVIKKPYSNSGTRAASSSVIKYSRTRACNVDRQSTSFFPSNVDSSAIVVVRWIRGIDDDESTYLKHERVQRDGLKYVASRLKHQRTKNSTGWPPNNWKSINYISKCRNTCL